MPRMCIRPEPARHSRCYQRPGRPRTGCVRLPVQHHASHGAGDAIQDLNAEDDKPAELIQTGRLHSGDDVVGPARSSANCTPSRSLIAWATLPTSLSTST
jgi:hypothetical protein